MPLFTEAEIAADLNPTQFVCADCAECFPMSVWHCPVCDHHWPADREVCSNCHEGRQPQRVAA